MQTDNRDKEAMMRKIEQINDFIQELIDDNLLPPNIKARIFADGFGSIFLKDDLAETPLIMFTNLDEGMAKLKDIRTKGISIAGKINRMSPEVKAKFEKFNLEVQRFISSGYFKDDIHTTIDVSIVLEGEALGLGYMKYGQTGEPILAFNNIDEALEKLAEFEMKVLCTREPTFDNFDDLDSFLGQLQNEFSKTVSPPMPRMLPSVEQSDLDSDIEIDHRQDEEDFSFRHYSFHAAETEKQGENFDLHLMNLALGLGEAGELQGKIKKMEFHGHKFNPAALLDEVGDILWYLDRIANHLGSSLEQVALANVEKLRKRYPNGFTEEDSINRSE